MIASRYWPVVFKQVLRHRTRSLLTVAGVTIAMFLFVTVQTLQHGVQEATQVTAADQTLVVYRANRFCPATSRLPQHYESRIARIAGVQQVTPIKVLVTNCHASLDVVTFRGVPVETIEALASQWEIIAGSVSDWTIRSDSALVGERLAQRRGLTPGESFSAAGVSVTVAGILRSSQPQDQDVVYVPLDFLQRSAGKESLGIVTQFNVKVSGPALLDPVAKAIDQEFRTDPEPTQTQPERAFVAQAGSDIVEIVRFTQILGWGCLAAVLALVANAIVLSVQDRIREHAVLQTLGFRGGLIARLIVSEGALIGVLGGLVGTLGALAVLHYGNFSLYNEGLSISFSAQPTVLVLGMVISAGVGIVAGLIPALQAARREIAQCFRAI